MPKKEKPAQKNQEKENKSSTGNKDIEENKAVAAIGYLGPLCLVPLLAKKESDFAQFHGKQGLVLCIGIVVSWVVIIIPFIGWLLFPLLEIAILVFMIMGIINALGGKKEKLPMIGDFADKINL
ncbi:MAG: DUF4870 domain-containing protein [Candidatus Moranbacteria bacterium]|nr:DUF4870 domain-containing protein [Candidatus Moranbacteria bacterium]